MFERVLICTDFSDGMQRFAAFIPELGVTGIKHIVFLHTVMVEDKGVITKINDEKIEEVRAKLTRSLVEVPDGMEVKVEVLSGKPVDKILKVADNYQSQLIILGSQARPIIAEKLIGSTMAELSQKTKIPLLVLRPQLISTYTPEELSLRCQHLFRSLLIPYNNSEAANYLVAQVKEFAQKQSNKPLESCLLCWITKSKNTRDVSKNYSFEEVSNTLSQVKTDLEEANLMVTTEIREGSSVTSVLEAAKKFSVSAIAVSTATIGKPQEWLVSSFAAEILRESWHPILFIPPHRK
jgi:nucleotide-binding universal stress UspA family protein